MSTELEPVPPVTAESLRLPPTRPEVLAMLKRLVEAINSRRRPRLDAVLAEISGLAERERRMAAAESRGRRLDRPQPSAATGPRSRRGAAREVHR
jgi:hypothetical protein